MSALPAGFAQRQASGPAYRDGGGQSELVERWSRRGVVTIVGPLLPGVFATGWAGWAGAHALSGAHVRTSIGALVAVVAIALAFGLALLYLALLGLVNRTTVRVTPGAVTRSVGPLPWSGAASIPRGSGVKIAVRERGAARGRSWDVVIVGASEAEHVLFRWMRTPEDAERVAVVLREMLARA